MSRRVGPTACRLLPLKRMLTVRFFVLVTCISFAISLIWMQLVTVSEPPFSNENLALEAIENVAHDSRYSEVYRKPSKLPKDLKYILLWTDRNYAPFYYFKEGQRAFIKNNCTVINCYVTNDRKFFGGDTTKFHAIAFNGRNMVDNDLPKHRSKYQKFIFMNMESADNFPVCSKAFDGFFNWTSTYKLDSDIPLPYIRVRNSNGQVIAPNIDMRWSSIYPEISKEYATELGNKSKAAAWFVSHCSSRSGRLDLVNRLQKALAVYGHTVDIYGKCGPLECPRDKKEACAIMLKNDYFFYLSFENSLAEDYVTEKLLTALQHDVVPIVYGGADYDRFLPAGCYIDSRKYTEFHLAAMIDRMMHAPKLYQQFFRWKGHLTFSDPSAVENVCDACAALNDPERFDKESSYQQFREWWHPKFRQRCSKWF